MWHSFAALSAGLLLIFLAGLPFARRLGATPLDIVAGALTIGLVLSTAILLAVGRFATMEMMLGGVALLGALDLVRARPRPSGDWSAPIVALAIVLYVSVLGYTAAAFVPTSDWDARSIWSFHAHILAVDGGMIHDPVWSDAELAWSAPAHPKLVPAVMALAMQASDGWNEFLPKTGLLLLSVPGFTALFALCGGGIAGAATIIVVFFVFSAMWANGLADAFLGLYGALAICHAARFFTASRPADLALAAAAAGIAVNLKVEGLIVAALTAAILAATLIRMGRARVRELPIAGLVAAGISVLAGGFWFFRKSAMGVTAPLHLNVGGDPWTQLMDRGPQLGRVAAYLFFDGDIGRTLAICAATLVVSSVLTRRLDRAIPLAALAGAAYFAAAILVYLIGDTPLDWMLENSGQRVAMPLRLLLLTLAGLSIAPRAAADRIEGHEYRANSAV